MGPSSLRRQAAAYIAAARFEGRKPGYKFQWGTKGVGYYLDRRQVASVPADGLVGSGRCGGALGGVHRAGLRWPWCQHPSPELCPPGAGDCHENCLLCFFLFSHGVDVFFESFWPKTPGVGEKQCWHDKPSITSLLLCGQCIGDPETPGRTHRPLLHSRCRPGSLHPSRSSRPPPPPVWARRRQKAASLRCAPLGKGVAEHTYPWNFE